MAPLRLKKRQPVIENQPKVWRWTKKYKIKKLAWGTDFLFDPSRNAHQNATILKMVEGYTLAEILRIVTYNNGQLLHLSGPRSPYEGKIGVIEVGALADLLLVDGNPLQDLSIIAKPQEKFLVIVKDGQIYKNLLK